ncbi:uncharacterized protein [Prorops nasuta]|uniref:uncharacterized protein n=1 Tax=Prorops nasuta TaxID=863751 RepID=UPI0034CF9588
MYRSTVKRTISRKTLHHLNERQRHRILKEIRCNVRKASRAQEATSNNENRFDRIKPNTECIDSRFQNPSYIAECNPTSLHFDMTQGDESNHLQSNSTLNFEIEQNESSNVSSESENNNHSLLDKTKPASFSSFKQCLSTCFVDMNVTHVQINKILSVIRLHPCLSNLPKDARSLLQTSRERITLFSVEPGKYVHFDVELKILQSLQLHHSASSLVKLDIDFHTDGCTLDRSGLINIWPIQMRVSNIKNSKPFIVGIYKGKEKPHDPLLFFEAFVSDIKTLLDNGGIHFNGKKIPITLRSFIADAPARAFILNHKGHMSHKPCSKCKIIGKHIEGRSIFNSINTTQRTDIEYVNQIDRDHHKLGQSPLAQLPIGMVTGVPFEYMHLVCLGVTKRVLSAWISGKFSASSKISTASLKILSDRCKILAKFCPSEFARRPRSLDYFLKFKATEFRQFLLYTGLIITYSIVDASIYKHFLFLQCAIRILSLSSPSSFYINFAEMCLRKFVCRCSEIYGPAFISYNVHGLLHLANDVRNLGSLDSFSAFPYENSMIFFRKYCRKPDLTLEQFCRRINEIEVNGSIDKCSRSVSKFTQRGATGNRRGFSKIEFKGFHLSTEERDNCCLLSDNSVCIIVDIHCSENSYFLLVKKFQEITDFYDIGIKSSELGIYKCCSLSDKIIPVSINNVIAKLYRMPLFCTDNNRNVEMDNENYSKFVVFTISHCDK